MVDCNNVTDRYCLGIVDSMMSVRILFTLVPKVAQNNSNGCRFNINNIERLAAIENSMVS